MSPPEVRINGSDPVARRWRWRWKNAGENPWEKRKKTWIMMGKPWIMIDGKTMEYEGKTMDYDGKKKVWENHPNRMDDSG